MYNIYTYMYTYVYIYVYHISICRYTHIGEESGNRKLRSERSKSEAESETGKGKLESGLEARNFTMAGLEIGNQNPKIENRAEQVIAGT